MRAGRGRARPAADDPVLARRGAGPQRRAVARGVAPARRHRRAAATRRSDGQPRCAGSTDEVGIAEPAARAARRVSRRGARGARLPADAGHDRARALLRRSRRHAARHPLAVRQPHQPRLGPGAAQALLPQVQLRAAGGGDRGRHRAVADHRAQLRARRGGALSAFRQRARRADPGAARRADVRHALALDRERRRSRCRASAAARRCRRSSRAWTPRICSPRCFPTSSPAPRTSSASARFPIIRWSTRPCTTACTRRWTSTGWSGCCAASRRATIRVVARDLTEPSPLALRGPVGAALRLPRRRAARGAPHAGGDGAALARRRRARPTSAGSIPRRSRACAPRRGPMPANADELHDALLWLGFLTEAEAAARRTGSDWLAGARASSGASTLLADAERRVLGRRRAPAAVPGAVARRRAATRRSRRPPAMRAQLDARRGAGRDPARPARRARARSRRRRWPRRSGLQPRRDRRCAGRARGRRLRAARPLHAGRQRATNGASGGCSRASIATRSSACAPRSSRSPRATSCASCSTGSASTGRRAHGRARTRSPPSSRSSKASRRRPAPGRPRSCRRASRTTSRPGSTICAWPGRIAWARLTPRMPRRRRASASRAGAHHADRAARAPPRAALDGAVAGAADDARSPSARAQAVARFPARARRLVLRRAGRRHRPAARRRSRRRWPSWWRSASSTSDSFGGLARAAGAVGPAQAARRRRAAPRASDFGMEDAGPLGAGAPRAARRPQPQAERRRDRARRAHAAAPLRRRVLAPARARGRRGCRRGAICCASIAGWRRAARSAAAASSPASPASSSRCPRRSALLRETRRAPANGALVSLSGADPLNLAGILTPGPKLAALTGNRLLYRDGVPVAFLAGGEVQFLGDLDDAGQWAAQKALLRSPAPALLADLA